MVWLAACCLFSFLISVDNLDGHVEVDREAFTQKVKAQAEQYRQQGLPPRAQVLFDAFKDFYINGLSVDDVAKKQLPIIGILR
ncbi:elongation factor P hydroxylase [Zymobacter palmae]|uniref:elongation factor P hydroxylase n=1 Tax=Zymobacter palmae TaxID=33074 RepID=UPI000489F45B|nr:elongation factor P hydroxylase [Zymobacter palmae]